MGKNLLHVIHMRNFLKIFSKIWQSHRAGENFIMYNARCWHMPGKFKKCLMRTYI